MSAPPELSMIILAYEDAPALPRVVAGLHGVLSGLGSRFEIVVVDDGSRDDTSRVAAELAASLRDVRVVGHERNRGVGAAFRTGVEAARGELVGYVDGDGQYAPEDLPRLVAAIVQADVVSGVRVRRADPWHRDLTSAVYRRLLRALYGLRLRDVNSGLKLYRREVLRRAWPLHSDGPFFDAEVLIKASRAGARIVELPIEHRPRLHGRARGISPASVLGAFAGTVREEMAEHLRPTAPARLLRRALQFALRRLPAAPGLVNRSGGGSPTRG